MAAIPGGLKAGASFGLENNGATTSFPPHLAAAVKLRLLKTDSQRDPAITATDRLQHLQPRDRLEDSLQLRGAAVTTDRLGTLLHESEDQGRRAREHFTAKTVGDSKTELSSSSTWETFLTHSEVSGWILFTSRTSVKFVYYSL